MSPLTHLVVVSAVAGLAYLMGYIHGLSSRTTITTTRTIVEKVSDSIDASDD